MSQDSHFISPEPTKTDPAPILKDLPCELFNIMEMATSHHIEAALSPQCWRMTNWKLLSYHARSNNELDKFFGNFQLTVRVRKLRAELIEKFCRRLRNTAMLLRINQ